VDLGERIRAEVQKRGLSGNRLAQETGLNQTRVARFLRGYACSLEMASALCGYLGLKLVGKKGRRG
jgi:ribosome-binding protein aMBF1 (putative translation factor)